MKKVKHIMCVLLTALMLVSLVPFSASASEYEAPDMPLLIAETEIVAGVQGEKTIDVNVADTEAVVENEAIATVAQKADTEDWVVTGLSVGETNVFITKGEQTVTVKVTVVQPTLDNPEMKLKIGDSDFFTAIGIGENAVWESSSEKVAVVDKNGLITAVGEGKAKIEITQGTLRLTGTVTTWGNVPLTKIILAKVKSPTSVKIKWKKSGEAQAYKIQMKKGGGKYKVVKTINKAKAKSALIDGLKPATVYKFRVKAYFKVNGKEYGKYSNAVTGITWPEKTSFTKVTVKSAHSVSLEWKPVAGATGYFISKKVSGGKYVFAMDVCSKKAKTAVVKGLKANKNYSFRIQAYKISGEQVAYAKASKAIKAKTPAKTSSSMKFYSKFPQVPDLGFIAGAKCVYDTVVNQNGHDFNMYYYNASGVCICESQWYIEMLEEYGFTYTEKPGLGISGMTGFVKDNTVVVLMADEDYFVVAVVEKL